MDHAGSVGGRDPIGCEHGPRRGGIASRYGLGEQRFVGSANEVAAGEFLDDVNMVAKHLFHQRLGEDDLFANIGTTGTGPSFARRFFDATSDIGDVRSNGETNVAGQGPRRGRPRQNRGIVVGEFELDIDRRFFHFFVAERHFVAGIRRPCLGAVRQHFVAPIQQALVEHLLEGPPGGLDVVVVQRHVGVVQIHPVRHAFGHFPPSGFVRPHRFSAGLVELGHPELFNGFVAHQIEPLLHLDFDREAVGVPATFSLDQKSFHGLPTAHEIFVGPSDHMVDSRFSVGGGWSFEENEGGAVATNVDGFLEGLVFRPPFQQVGFQLNGVQFTRWFRLSHVPSTGGPVFNLTPKDVHFCQTVRFFGDQNDVLNGCVLPFSKDTQAHASSPSMPTM